MRFMTFLIFFTTIIIGTSHTVIVSAVPHAYRSRGLLPRSPTLFTNPNDMQKREADTHHSPRGLGGLFHLKSAPVKKPIGPLPDNNKFIEDLTLNEFVTTYLAVASDPATRSRIHLKDHGHSLLKEMYMFQNNHYRHFPEGTPQGKQLRSTNPKVIEGWLTDYCRTRDESFHVCKNKGVQGEVLPVEGPKPEAVTV
ncbi:hypothetical protein BC835DRAFT_272429 [Cytidiella melzeri]|nr:hypothetical protein BC835DRAFT_272429 [Cytidiella melzeri]